MFKKMFLVLLIVILFPILSYADFQAKFTNETKTNRTVIFNWWSHSFGGNRPASMVGADIKPGKSYLVKHSYKPGIYEVFFSNNRGENPHSIVLKIKENITFIEFIDTDNGIIVIKIESKESIND